MAQATTHSTFKRAGFTLSEILLAMLVFAIAITTILALLARSIETVDEIILKDEAMRLSGAMESELAQLTFNEVYALVRQLGDGSPTPPVLHVLHYRVDPQTLQPRISRDGNPGEDYLVIPFVGTVLDAESDQFRAREGRYFQVRLLESATNPVAMVPDPNNYMSAVVVIYAEFVPLAVPTMNAYTTTVRPVYSYNFAVRR